jgi:hypothetical protein
MFLDFPRLAREGCKDLFNNFLCSGNSPVFEERFLKADSHIACRAHAVPLPAKGLEYVFPIWFTQCGRVWFTFAMTRPCHARPCRSSQGHGTVLPPRDGLWVTSPRSASSGYHAEFHEGCYQQHTNLSCRWPVWNQTPFVVDEEKSGSSTLQKRQSVTLLD